MTIQNKKVKIYKRYENKLTIKDNGIGLKQHEYDLLCVPFMRESLKNDQIEEIETLKLGIAIRILM